MKWDVKNNKIIDMFSLDHLINFKSTEVVIIRNAENKSIEYVGIDTIPTKKVMKKSFLFIWELYNLNIKVIK